MKSFIIVHILQIFILIISFVILIGQFYLYEVAAFYYIEKRVTAPLDKYDLNMIFIIMGLLSCAVSILALMSIRRMVQKVIKKLPPQENPLPLRHTTKITLLILGTITSIVLGSCISIYWYGFVDGTRTDPQVKCGPSVTMGLFITLLSLTAFSIIIWIASVFCEVKKYGEIEKNKLEKLPKE